MKPAPIAHGRTFERMVGVLEEKRHPGKRTRKLFERTRACMLVERGHDGVELRVQLLRTIDGGLQNLAWVDFPVCNERREA